MAGIDVDSLPPPPGAQTSAAIDVDSLPPPPTQSVKPTLSSSSAIDVDSLPPPPGHIELPQDLVAQDRAASVSDTAPNLELNPQAPTQAPTVQSDPNVLKNIHDAAMAPVHTVLQVMQVPASAVGHAVAAITDPELNHYASMFMAKDGIIKGFLEAPVLVGDVAEKHIENSAHYVANAISPVGDWTQNSPGFRQALASFVGGITPFASHVAAMGINTITDPLVWVTFGGDVASPGTAFQSGLEAEGASGVAIDLSGGGGATTFEMTKGLQGEFTYQPNPQEVMTNVDPAVIAKRGLGESVAAGDKALVQALIPGTKTPILQIKGQAVANLIDRVSADYWGSQLGQTMASSFTGKSYFPMADAYLDAHAIETPGVAYMTKQAADALEPLDENIIRHAALQGEFPNAYHDVTSTLKLEPLSPEEMVLSLERQNAWKQLDLRAQVQMEKVGGHIPEFNPAPVIDQQKAIQDLLRKGDINPAQAELFQKMGFSEDRGYGRAMTDEAKQVFDELTSAGKSYGNSVQLRDKTASTMERSKFSTPAQNILWGQKLGLPEPFNAHQDQIVLRNFADNMQAASDIKLIKGITQSYGKSLDGWAQSIAQANKTVGDAYAAGLPVNHNVAMMHGLDTDALAKHTAYAEVYPDGVNEINQVSTKLDTSKLAKMPDYVCD